MDGDRRRGISHSAVSLMPGNPFLGGKDAGFDACWSFPKDSDDSLLINCVGKSLFPSVFAVRAVPLRSVNKMRSPGEDRKRLEIVGDSLP